MCPLFGKVTGFTLFSKADFRVDESVVPDVCPLSGKVTGLTLFLKALSPVYDSVVA